jgi:dihydroxyacetone kinase phosphoprotein-dependent L subunit
MAQHDCDGVLAAVCRRVQERKDWLSELDAACGDGDHGVSVARGFHAIEEQLPSWGGLTPGALLRKAGMTLVSATGGAAGPLLGTLFIEAGKVMGDRSEVTVADLGPMFGAGFTAVCKRGGAQPGDRTLLDALAPAIEALKKAEAGNLTMSEALACALDAARAGAEATKDMMPKQGKSRYLGERALGHPDAGAYTIVTIIEALVEAAN